MKQQALRLRTGRWGGRREGAGGRPGPNPRIPHASREPFPRTTPCHVTLKVRKDVPTLRARRMVRELERSFAAGAERGDFRVVHYSVQRDHVHLIVEAAHRQALGRGMKAIGARVARAANRVFQRSGPVLADRYHVRLLRTPRQVRNALRYVLLNVRKHRSWSRGRVRVDPASSGRWFDGWRLGLPAASDPPPVPRARTWLLRIGWRQHGLLDPGELPAPG